MKNLSLILIVLFFAFNGCDKNAPKSTSGVQKQTVKVQTGSNGLTVEQENIRTRLLADNKPGSIKHLYVISPYSGQVILYSTVKGKITSSGKRLSPYMVESAGEDTDGFPIRIGNWEGTTAEVLQDDGTYGHSDPYIYWWDVQGRYHQHFFTGGQIIHLSDQPIPVKNIILNLEK